MITRLCALALLLLLGGCAGPAPYVYRYVPGRTAELQNGVAIAPPGAPEAVVAAVAAGNRIAGLPYSYGAGHTDNIEAAYDCSGAASYVLRGAGLTRHSMPSRAFRKFGDSGYGRWISIYARRDHVFLVVAGLRFDTSYHGGTGNRGPAWSTQTRPASGSVVRHPRGY